MLVSFFFFFFDWKGNVVTYHLVRLNETVHMSGLVCIRRRVAGCAD